MPGYWFREISLQCGVPSQHYLFHLLMSSFLVLWTNVRHSLCLLEGQVQGYNKCILSWSRRCTFSLRYYTSRHFRERRKMAEGIEGSYGLEHCGDVGWE
jgi:hypothetical protein